MTIARFLFQILIEALIQFEAKSEISFVYLRSYSEVRP